MHPPRLDKFRHVVFIENLVGTRALNLAPKPNWPSGTATEEHIAPTRCAAGLTDEESRFARWLFRQAGLHSRHYREETLRRRLQACLRVLRCDSIGEARTVLARHKDLVPTAMASVLIGVSSFFRDPQVFQTLREDVLPRLLARARPEAQAAGRPLYVWAVGCSEGQELYSLAMLLAERGALRRSYLYGTDCREDAIRAAAAGIYHDETMRTVPPEKLLQHFRPLANGQWQVHDELRKFCRWQRADAMQTGDPGRWDIIFCRNMAMYLQPASADALWAKLESALAPGGVLVLGRAERPANVGRLVMIAPCIYRKLGA
jgi:chemotaxis methyl-accepting protein methylase